MSDHALKIGFLDRSLNNVHANVFIDLLREMNVEVTHAYESSPESQGDWCADHSVQRCAYSKEVVEATDAIMVLAPNNIDDHLALGREAYKSGKPVYVDKYLANRYDEAQAIVALCGEHGTPLISASALRFCEGLEAVLQKHGDVPAEVFARGPGDWERYAIHTIAPVVRLLGPHVERLVHTGTDDTAIVSLAFRGGAQALIEVRDGNNVYEVFAWDFGVKQGGAYHRFSGNDGGAFYRRLMQHVASFMRTGQSDITPATMLTEVWILDRAEVSHRTGGTWQDACEDAVSATVPH